MCWILDVRSRPETKAFLSFLILESNIQINLSMFVYLSIYSFSYSVASSCSPPFFLKGWPLRILMNEKNGRTPTGIFFLQLILQAHIKQLTNRFTNDTNLIQSLRLFFERKGFFCPPTPLCKRDGTGSRMCTIEKCLNRHHCSRSYLEHVKDAPKACHLISINISRT